MLTHFPLASPQPLAAEGPRVTRLIGSSHTRPLSRRISTYLKPARRLAHPFARVATARRDPSSPQDWPSVFETVRRPLYQVVSPASYGE